MISLQVIGASVNVQKIEYVVNRSFPMLESEYLYHDHFSETPNIIKSLKKFADIVLFVGQISYNLNKEYLNHHNVFNKYIAPCRSSLSRALFEAKLRGFDLTNISLDSYSTTDIEYLQVDLNHTLGDIKVYQIDDDLYGIQQEKITSEHINNYLSNKVGCCFTTMYATHKRLAQLKIPNILIGHSVAKIEETIHSALLEYKFYREIDSEKPVILNIRVDDYDEHSIYHNDDYQQSIHIGKISTHVHNFARQLNAATVHSTHKEFWIFTNERTLRIHTDNFKNIDLTKNIYNSSTHTVSVGIGYADNSIDAKKAAAKALQRAINMGGNKAIICKNDEFMTPLESVDSSNKEIIDTAILSIAQKSGITIKQAFKLISILQAAPDKSFTSAELAALMDYNIRTLNRLLEKLEFAGYCSIIGKKLLSGAGRPSRVIKFKFDKFILDNN